MREHQPYDIHEISDYHFHFITDNEIVYDVFFNINQDYFPEFPEGCPTCSDILEMKINSSEDKPPKDKRTAATIFKILESILSESCNGVIYRCRDDDDRGCVRERRFDSWYEEFGDDQKVDKWINDYSDGNGVNGKMYLLVDKGCINYHQVVDDFSYQCEPCLKYRAEE